MGRRDDLRLGTDLRFEIGKELFTVRGGRIDFRPADPLPLEGKDGAQEGKEGCLSFPNMGGRVVRADQVTCQYADVSGRMQIITVRGFLARAVQHETDHLNGVLYVDLMSAVDKLAIADKLKKLAKKNGGNL